HCDILRRYFSPSICSMSTLATLAYLLYRHDQHRPRHSFPTRRSSDLPPARGNTPFHSRRSTVRPPRLRDQPAASIARRGGRTVEDRKSTRLNSSHGSISYAVFCLKKKTHSSPTQTIQYTVISSNSTNF